MCHLTTDERSTLKIDYRNLLSVALSWEHRRNLKSNVVNRYNIFYIIDTEHGYEPRKMSFFYVFVQIYGQVCPWILYSELAKKNLTAKLPTFMLKHISTDDICDGIN